MGTPTDKHSLFVSCLDLTITNIYPYYKCKRNAVSSMTKEMLSACARSSLHLNTQDCCNIENTVARKLNKINQCKISTPFRLSTQISAIGLFQSAYRHHRCKSWAKHFTFHNKL